MIMSVAACEISEDNLAQWIKKNRRRQKVSPRNSVLIQKLVGSDKLIY